VSTTLLIAIVRDGEQFLFLFQGPDDLVELSRAVGRHAANPDLSFTWRDAATVIQRAESLLAGAR
jgi:hypothetical protein